MNSSSGAPGDDAGGGAGAEGGDGGATGGPAFAAEHTTATPTNSQRLPLRN
ncbi:MAG TPA: hypothetical protein VF917_06085 [Steroidobacteraceae bacterium]